MTLMLIASTRLPNMPIGSRIVTIHVRAVSTRICCNKEVRLDLNRFTDCSVFDWVSSTYEAWINFDSRSLHASLIRPTRAWASSSASWLRLSIDTTSIRNSAGLTNGGNSWPRVAKYGRQSWAEPAYAGLPLVKRMMLSNRFHISERGWCTVNYKF